jgi:hypothetical protein
MAGELVLAIGIPVALLLIFTLLLEHWGERLPSWLRGLSRRPSLIWNVGVGLIIALSALRWLLKR